MKRGTKRLNRFSALKGEAHNEAKRYRLPEEAVRLIRDASKLYGTQGRAIQFASELLFRFPNQLNLPQMKDPANAAMTYKLSPRTIAILEHLAKTRYGTRGRVLAACAVLLARTPGTPSV